MTTGGGQGHAQGMPLTAYEFVFVIPDVDAVGDPRLEAAQGRLDDLVVEAHGGLTLATVSAEGVDAVEAGRRVAVELTACGLPPERTHPDLVTRQEIADRVDMTRQAVGNWVRRERHHADPFPIPVHLVGGGVWLWGEVVEWLRRSGRDIDEGIEFPSIDEHIRIDALLLRERCWSVVGGRTMTLVDPAFTVVPSDRMSSSSWTSVSVRQRFGLAV